MLKGQFKRGQTMQASRVNYGMLVKIISPAETKVSLPPSALTCDSGTGACDINEGGVAAGASQMLSGMYGPTSPNVMAASRHQRTGWSMSSRASAVSEAGKGENDDASGSGARASCPAEDTPAVNPAVAPGCGGGVKWVVNRVACRSMTAKS